MKNGVISILLRDKVISLLLGRECSGEGEDLVGSKMEMAVLRKYLQHLFAC